MVLATIAFIHLSVSTSMILVPSRDGVSHNPTEYTSPENCALGAQVLLQSVLGFDRIRAERRVIWSYQLV